MGRSQQHVTIYEVADRAGVSISTVSLSLNSPSRVSDSTRTKVLDAATQLGFVPRSEAVSRARRALGRIGVLAPFTSYPSFARRLNGVLGALRGEPIEVIVFDQESAARNPSPLLDTLPITQRLDGLLVMALPLGGTATQRLHRSGLPAVVVDIEDDRFDSVHVDDHGGGRLAARHLLDRGYEHFGFVGEDQRSHAYVSPAERRLAGFRAALTEAGATLPDDAVVLVDRSSPDDARPISSLLEAGRPVAVFCHDDVLAAGVLRAARRLGLRVPHDIAVVGFDDGDLAAALGLSTVRQPLEDSGAEAARLLLERVRQPNRIVVTRNVQLGLSLVARDTT